MCSIFTEYSVCIGALDNFGNIIFDGVINHYFDSEFVCTTIKACSNHFIALNADDYARSLLKDKPLNSSNWYNNKIQTNSTILKVLHVSDIHTDQDYQEVKYF